MHELAFAVDLAASPEATSDATLAYTVCQCQYHHRHRSRPELLTSFNLCTTLRAQVVESMLFCVLWPALRHGVAPRFELPVDVSSPGPKPALIRSAICWFSLDVKMPTNSSILFVVSVGALLACGSGKDVAATDRTHSIDHVPIEKVGSLAPFVAASGDTARMDDDRAYLVTEMADSVGVGRISAMHRVGDQLIVFDALLDPHIAALDVNGTVSWRVGKNGTGRNEFQTVHWMQRDPHMSERVWLYDFDARRLTPLTIRRNRAPVLGQAKSLDVGASIERPFLSGSRFIANGVFDGYTVAFIDTNGTPTRRFAMDLPFTQHELSHSTGRRLLNRTFLVGRPSGDRLGIVYQWVSRVDVIDTASRLLSRTIGPRPSSPRFRLANDAFVWEQDALMGYTGVAATESFIYATFCGCTLAERRGPQLLHIYDWQGRFRGEVRLPGETTALFAEGDSVLYLATQRPHRAILRLPLDSTRFAGPRSMPTAAPNQSSRKSRISQ